MNKSFEINKNIYLIEVLLQGIEDFSELWKISYDNEIWLNCKKCVAEMIKFSHIREIKLV